MGFNASGDVVFTVSYLTTPGPSGRSPGLVELAPHPFRDGALLALERSHSRTRGNRIALFEVDLADCVETSSCESITVDECGDCVVGGGGASTKRELLRWTDNTMVFTSTGETVQVATDNYEALCLHPEAGRDGERLALLVNDDNDNAYQIGTQFVLLAFTALPLAEPRLNASELDDQDEDQIPMSSFLRSRPEPMAGSPGFLTCSGGGTAGLIASIMIAVIVCLGLVFRQRMRIPGLRGGVPPGVGETEMVHRATSRLPAGAGFESQRQSAGSDVPAIAEAPSS